MNKKALHRAARRPRDPVATAHHSLEFIMRHKERDVVRATENCWSDLLGIVGTSPLYPHFSADKAIFSQLEHASVEEALMCPMLLSCPGIRKCQHLSPKEPS